MHIAVCDDNVADRKQFERLMKRESDRRGKDGCVLFADYFGHAQALLAAPFQYDVFYIDMCKTSDTDTVQIINALLQKGIVAPIILCCSDIDYRTLQLPCDTLFLEKPIRPEELTKTIDYALERKSETIPRIELRDEHTTYHVTEEEILYAVQEGQLIDIHMTDGRVIRVLDNALNLFSQLEPFPTFLAPNLKAVLNGRYIQGFKFRKVIMQDGREFKIARECIPYAKEIYSTYH